MFQFLLPVMTRAGCALALASALLLAPVSAARADDFDDDVIALNDNNSSAQVTAIETLATLGDKRAVLVLQALIDGRLYFHRADGAVVIATPEGDHFTLVVASTQEADGEAMADDLDAIAADDDVVAAARTAIDSLGPYDAGANLSGAQDFPGLVKALNADTFGAKSDAVKKLTDLGDPNGARVLAAMADGRLFSRVKDKTLVIGDPLGGNNFALTDASTLQPAGQASGAELQQITINNSLRGLLRDGVGRLGLQSSDPRQRTDAATALLSSPAVENVALLNEALKQETDAGVKRAMQLALAAADLTDPAAETRLAAVALLTGSIDPLVRNLLAERAHNDDDAGVRKAAQAALDQVKWKLTLLDLAANLFQGVSLGSVLLLAAIGLAITFGVMGVINMAHGEMMMLGAYTAYVVQEVFRAFLPPGMINLYLVVAIPVAFLFTALVGVALERGVIRFLYGRPLETLLATWGISLMLQQLVRTIFGSPNKEVANPAWMTGGFEAIGGFVVTWNRIYIIVFCFAILGALVALLRWTPFGLHMRAVTQNRQMASVMGIGTAKVDALTFGLGSGIAGMAGVALSQIGNVSPNLGQLYIVDSFMVVVFGGVGNLAGTLVGAMTLGIVNKFLEPVAGAVLGKVVVLVAIILFIQKRPRGMFALKGRSVDA